MNKSMLGARGLKSIGWSLFSALCCPRPVWACAIWIALLAPLLAHGQSEIEPNNTPASATPLDLSSGFASVPGAIASAGDVDFFSFIAPAGSRAWILVDTGGASTPGADSTDSFLSLMEANGITSIEDDDDDGSGNGCDSTEESGFASTIAGRLLTTGGTHFIRVSEFGDDGILSPYRLFVVLSTAVPTSEVEPNGSALAPNALLTQSQSIGLRAANIGQAGDMDFFALELTAGQTVFISVDCDPERDGLGTDIELTLLGLDRTTPLYVANSSADEGDAAEGFCYTVPVAGTYFVRVTHVDTGIGSYQLMAAIKPPGSLQFTMSNHRRLEGPGSVIIAVERTGGSAGTVTVRYETRDGSARAPEDYQSAAGLLTFGDGVMRREFTVMLTDDTHLESNEYLDLVLSMPTGGAILGNLSQARLSILDDDEMPNASPASATPLEFLLGLAAVTNVAGAGLPAISPPGDEDWYSFTAPSMARVWVLVDTGGPQSPAATSRDSQVTLLAADGQTLLETDDDDGVSNGFGPAIDLDGDLASAISGRLLEEGGTYYLRIQAFDPEAIIDPYRLFVLVSSQQALSETPHNDSPAEADAIQGSPIGHRLASINPAGDEDWYALSMAQGGFFWAALDADPYRIEQSTDVVLDVIAPDGITVLLSVDSSGNNPEAAESVCFQVDAPGLYYLRVRHFLATETGPYSLMVVRWPGDVEPNNTISEAVPLRLSQGMGAAGGSIAPAGDVDYFSFTAGATARLWATLDTGGAAATGANSRDSVLTLLAADGTTVIEEDWDDGIGNGCDASIESLDGSTINGRTLIAGGTYYLKVRAADPAAVIHPYRLTVTLTTVSPLAEQEGNGSAATATPLLAELANQGLRQGSLSSAADIDVYSVYATAGSLLHVCADADPERDGSGTDLRLELLAPDGVTVLLDADSSTGGTLADPAGEGFCFRVDRPGVYYVQIRSARGGAGSYFIMTARDRIPLRIVSRAVIGQDVRVGFLGLSGMRYRLERAPSLTASPAWIPVSDALAGNDSVVVATDVGGATLSHCFYRVVQVP